MWGITGHFPVGKGERMVTVDMVRFVNAVLKNDEQSSDDELRTYFESCDIPSEVVDYCIAERNLFLNNPQVEVTYERGKVGAIKITGKPRSLWKNPYRKIVERLLKGATNGKGKTEKVETPIRRG
jgi:hypothetical protein